MQNVDRPVHIMDPLQDGPCHGMVTAKKKRRASPMMRADDGGPDKCCITAAFLLGWFASWLIHRLSRVTRAEMGELESMAQQLHEAEETRDRAISELEEREADLVAKLSTAEAELLAVRGELRETHAEIEELRDYIERKSSKKT